MGMSRMNPFTAAAFATLSGKKKICRLVFSFFLYFMFTPVQKLSNSQLCSMMHSDTFVRTLQPQCYQ